ncbi:class I SAM-dependent methyltransferase [candidate division KSB1 bacterium]
MDRFSQIDRIPDKIVNDYNDIASVYNPIMGDDYTNIIINPYYNLIIRSLRNQSKLRFLDIGCGAGAFLYKCAEKFEADFFGIDLSYRQIEEARKKAKKSNCQLHFEIGDLVDINYPKNCDVITLNLDTLNHITNINNWSRVFAKVFSALRRGGIFLFDVNSKKRLLEDWHYPEVIVKEKMTYVQCEINSSYREKIARSKILMKIFASTNDKFKIHTAIIEQISVSKSTIQKMLEKNGFVNIKIVDDYKNFKSNHIFLKNRLFFQCRK